MRHSNHIDRLRCVEGLQHLIPYAPVVCMHGGSQVEIPSQEDPLV